MRRATIMIGREGFGIEAEPRFGIASLQFEQRQMPVQMSE